MFAEAGLVVVSLVIAGLPLVLLWGTWRNATLSFRGRSAAGRITRMERTGRRVWHGTVSFRTSDGREMSLREPMSGHLRVGTPVTVHYDPSRPERATRRPAAGVAALLLGLAALAAVGLTGLAGTIYTAGAGGFGAFLNWYSIPLFLVFAAVFFAAGYRNAREVFRWNQRVAAPGLVTRVDMAKNPSSDFASRGSYPWVRFETGDGRKVEFRENIATAALVGSRVTVYYDPQFPEETATILGMRRSAG